MLNVNVDGSLAGGETSSFVISPNEEFGEFVSVFSSEELVGSNVNRFFPFMKSGFDLVIHSSNKESINIVIIPLN